MNETITIQNWAIFDAKSTDKKGCDDITTSKIERQRNDNSEPIKKNSTKKANTRQLFLSSSASETDDDPIHVNANPKSNTKRKCNSNDQSFRIVERDGFKLNDVNIKVNKDVITDIADPVSYVVYVVCLFINFLWIFFFFSLSLSFHSIHSIYSIKNKWS